MRQVGAIVIVAALLCVGVSATAAPLRKADIGSPMKDLLKDLNRLDRGVAGRCGDTPVSYTAFVTPNRPQDDDHASFVAFSVKDRLAIVVAYDEEDLSVPVTVYADLDGTGTVTNLWAIDKAPHPCAIMSQLR